jgi:hypothetical protein
MPSESASCSWSSVQGHELAEGARLFHRVQVAALDVLDERELQHLLVFDFADDDGHAGQARELRGAPAALAGDELVEAGAGGADDDGLQQAVLLQRLRERFNFFRSNSLRG